MKTDIPVVFFGTSIFSTYVLDMLAAYGIVPRAVVTFPDKPQGRKLVLTQNPVKAWAHTNGVSVIETNSLKKDTGARDKLKALGSDVFVVASFGRILPADIIYMPPHKTLNVHPSLLPKLRGPSPIQGAILGEDKTGVTIMRLDEKMDDGPIVAQKVVSFETWPERYSTAERWLGEAGGALLAEVLPKWVRGEIEERPQDHSQATYTHMIKKEEADISNDTPEIAIRKIKAFEVWPRARLGELIVTEAHIEDGKLVLDKVIPPGKKEMPYADYLRGAR